VFIAAAAFGRILSVDSGIRTVETIPAAETTVPAAETTVPAAEQVPARTGPTMTLPFRRARTETVPAGQASNEDTQAVQ
jgi:hypothetical protein